MSTFSGTIEEIPGISVDRFKSSLMVVNFLSHCHTDHMIGLDQITDIYSSPISATILHQMYPDVTVHELQLGVPTIVALHNNTSVTVTTLSSGHCPGSIMFLFETDKFKILYTGDFRIAEKDLKGFSTINYLVNNCIQLDTIYIDSTFLSNSYKMFPTQKQTAQCLTNIIKEWFIKCKSNKVFLHLPANYGSEFLFNRINKDNFTKVHVDDEIFAIYRHWKCMDHCVTNNPKEARVFASFNSNKYNPDDKNLRFIRLSAWCWTFWDMSMEICKYNTDQNINVCYSNHASYKEIRDFVQYLKPRRLKLNVLPEKEQDRKEMLQLAKDLLQVDFNTNHDTFVGSSVDVEFQCKNRSYSKTSDGAIDDDEISKLSLNIPKRRKKMTDE